MKQRYLEVCYEYDNEAEREEHEKKMNDDGYYAIFEGEWNEEKEFHDKVVYKKYL